MMSAEQMRVELESFVNKGLKEGLRGWPVKASLAQAQASDRLYFAMPTAAALFRCVTEGSLGMAERLAWRTDASVVAYPSLEAVRSAFNIRSLTEFPAKNRFCVTVGRIAPL